MRRIFALAALVLVAGTAEAQVQARRFSVGAQGGGIRFDDAAGLKNAAFAGIDAMYQLPVSTRLGGLDIGVGFALSASLPVTQYDQFPAVLFDFGDTSVVYGVSQRVQLLEYGAQASVGSTFGRLRAYGIGGAGLYTFTVDPRQEGRRSSTSSPAFQVGAGLNYLISSIIGVRAEVRSVTFTGYDRDKLDPSIGYARDRRLRDELATPVREKSTINNLKAAIVFSYVPGAGADANAGATP